MSGEPLAVTFRLKLPPTQIPPPTGCALIEISGVTINDTSSEYVLVQPLAFE
jgi:hypothetical protein